jgi:hypothetical protein
LRGHPTEVGDAQKARLLVEHPFPILHVTESCMSQNRQDFNSHVQSRVGCTGPGFMTGPRGQECEARGRARHPGCRRQP